MRRQCTLLLFVSAVCFASCTDGVRAVVEAELSDFGAFVEQLDTSALRQAFSEVVKKDAGRTFASDDMVRQHYADTATMEGVPLWFTRMGVAKEADEMLDYLRREVPLAGLDSTVFLVQEIAADLGKAHALQFDSVAGGINKLLARLDYNLSRAYMRLAVGQRAGFMSPSQVFNRLDRRVNDEAFSRLFDYEVATPDKEEAMRQLRGGNRMGFLRSSEPQTDLYQAYKRSLALCADSAQRHKLAVNMERCRWRMESAEAGGPRVVINLAAQQLWAVGRDSDLTMRVCIGSTLTKTPLLHSQITYLQVNPDWIITPNIIKNEVSRHGGDSAYFARHRYYIVDKATSDTLNPVIVSPDQLRSGSLRVGQKGGAGNSLGRIVFRFPNNFSVYLHDTNNRGAFQSERRTLSHGCVRVEKPFELACFLLPDLDAWTLDRFRISMDLPPQTEQGRNYLRSHANARRPFRLIGYHGVSPAIPIYIIYQTAYPNPSTGLMEYWPDIYGYDAVVSRSVPVV